MDISTYIIRGSLANCEGVSQNLNEPKRTRLVLSFSMRQVSIPGHWSRLFFKKRYWIPLMGIQGLTSVSELGLRIKLDLQARKPSSNFPSEMAKESTAPTRKCLLRSKLLELSQPWLLLLRFTNFEKETKRSHVLWVILYRQGTYVSKGYIIKTIDCTSKNFGTNIFFSIS